MEKSRLYGYNAEAGVRQTAGSVTIPPGYFHLLGKEANMKKAVSFIMKDILKAGPGSGHLAAGIVVIEVLTGFFLSFLIEVNLGTDPCTFMNLVISSRLKISFGSWQLILNAALFAFVIVMSRFRYIGIGTLANMICIGYSADFSRWLWKMFLPSDIFSTYPGRIIFFVIGLVGFVLCCAVYMNYDMGLSPYDATPYIIHSLLKKVPFTAIRVLWDFGIIGIGCLLGGTPPVATLILAVALGPAVSFAGKLMKKSA